MPLRRRETIPFKPDRVVVLQCRPLSTVNLLLERHCYDRIRMSDDDIPDIRDGLTRKERIVLKVLHDTQRERGDRNVPTAMLWGRVCEYFYISPEDLTEMLARLGARK